MEHILSLSYGKDSLACLGAIEELGWPLERIVHAEVWATDTIHADYTPMVEFKAKADAIIKERWGIVVELVRSSTTFEQQFYSKYKKGEWAGKIYGWPRTRGSWCVDRLKTRALDKIKKDGRAYIGIASDEIRRIKRPGDKPLVSAKWTESMCREWCEKNKLLSPIYTTTFRGGCWFCPKQPIEQLRMLRKKYPEYWEMMLKWDKDSPRAFRSDGHTVRDYDRRFQMEDEWLIRPDDRFRWTMLEDEMLNYRIEGV